MTGRQLPEEFLGGELDELLHLDDAAGPARRITAASASLIVERVLDEAATDIAPPVPVLVSQPARRWSARVAMVALALLITVGGASAAVYRFVIAPEQGEATAPLVVSPSTSDEEPDVDGVDLADPEPPPVVDVEPPPVRVEPSPDKLLAMASRMRKKRRWREADKLYTSVVRNHRSTTAGYVALVSSAQLRLDHLRNTRGALRLYKRALRDRPNGHLAEEARYGVAESYRALGRRERERRALQAFVANHPGSLLLARAKQRLVDLAASSE